MNLQEPKTPIHFDPNAIDNQSYPPTWKERQERIVKIFLAVIAVHAVVVGAIAIATLARWI